MGFEKFENFNTYKGEFLHGKAHGNGVYSWANGEVFEGQWMNGMKEGKGEWRGLNGE